MRHLWLSCVVLCAGCAAKPAAPSTAPQASPPSADLREAAARRDIAVGVHVGKRPTSGPAVGAARLRWRGLDLSHAPVTIHTEELPEIWEAKPAGSKSYEIRGDVTVIPPKNVFTDATVYWIESRNRFYVQSDELGSSTLHYYGPFKGNPHQVLTPPPTEAAGQ